MNIFMGLNHTAAILTPEGLKTFVLPTETRSQIFQLEPRGQYGRRAIKVH